MTGALLLGLALVAAQASDPHVIDSWTVETTDPLSGADFRLILEAFRHPAMRGRDLSCYHIVVSRERGTTSVAFLGDREPERIVPEGDHQVIIMPGQNRRCPTLTFEMTPQGHVWRVIPLRPDHP